MRHPAHFSATAQRWMAARSTRLQRDQNYNQSLAPRSLCPSGGGAHKIAYTRAEARGPGASRAAAEEGPGKKPPRAQITQCARVHACTRESGITCLAREDRQMCYALWGPGVRRSLLRRRVWWRQVQQVQEAVIPPRSHARLMERCVCCCAGSVTKLCAGCVCVRDPRSAKEPEDDSAKEPEASETPIRNHGVSEVVFLPPACSCFLPHVKTQPTNRSRNPAPETGETNLWCLR